MILLCMRLASEVVMSRFILFFSVFLSCQAYSQEGFNPSEECHYSTRQDLQDQAAKTLSVLKNYESFDLSLFQKGLSGSQKHEIETATLEHNLQLINRRQ